MSICFTKLDTSAEASHARMVHVTVENANRCMGLGGQENYSAARKELSYEMTRLYQLQSQGQNVETDIARIMACYNRLNTLQPLRPKIVIGNSHFPITVKYDAGLGNTIELRGAEKASLSWQSGKALHCKGRDDWETSISLPPSVTSFDYKVTLRKRNGEVLWEQLPENGNRVFTSSFCFPLVITPVFKG